tara:strand:+ start:346 stop:525 length:180 start_codon:yes stop_codon:yes gene_type:complete
MKKNDYVHTYGEMVEDMTKRENDNRQIRLERYEEELKALYRKIDKKIDQINHIKEREKR